jgi:hypothetical protein
MRWHRTAALSGHREGSLGCGPIARAPGDLEGYANPYLRQVVVVRWSKDLMVMTSLPKWGQAIGPVQRLPICAELVTAGLFLLVR